MEEKRVCVVGAGVSGLTTCKRLVERGFRPVVFEAEGVVGGLWNRTMKSTRLQTPCCNYRFSDHPWSEKVRETFPDGGQVAEYVSSYARSFDLLRHVRFGERVVSLKYVGASEVEMEEWDSWADTSSAFGRGGGRGEWHVTVVREVDGTEAVHVMDFVVLCIGRFSGIPNIPTFPLQKGPEVFHGKVIHSMDYSNMGTAAAAQLVKGKRVAVVGFLKSAVDIAAECANLNGPSCPCTMVVRTKRWNVPSLTAWGIPLKYFYFTRFGEMFFHKPGEGLFSWVLATLLSPLVWIISKFAESYYKKTIPMQKHGMVPEHSFFHALSSCLLCILPCRFYDMVEQGSIVLKPSKTFEFCRRGIIIDGQSSPIAADLVIFATGYRGDQKLRNIFVSRWFQKIVTDSQDHIVPLYRECIHPQIPQMAIIGYTESMSNLHTSEMCARWLACFLHGNFKLPSKRCMEKVVREWEQQTRRYSKIKSRGSCIFTLHIWKNDQLLNDMGCNPRRKKGHLANWFLPYSPTDYAEIVDRDEKKIVH